MGRTRRAAVAASVAVTGVLVLLVGCASASTSDGVTAPPPARVTEAGESSESGSGSAGASPPSRPPSPPPGPTPSPAPTARPRAAEIDIPSIGVADLRVVPYEGKTDDRVGTRIQDRGVAASPYGDRGGVGPGDIGNYQVTAHRLSAGGPLRDLPEVEVGDLVHVTAGGDTYTYRIVETRSTSFRSERSLAEQRAAVPGEPGERPTQAMITLSTCATPEDDAAGNFWRDAQGNPEHRIDKIGLLTATRPASD